MQKVFPFIKHIDQKWYTEQNYKTVKTWIGHLLKNITMQILDTLLF